MKSAYLIPDGCPVYLPGGKTGCILVHGFTCMPKEMEYLAEDLHQRGFSIFNARLAGHGSRPEDLMHLGWRDWLASIEDAFHILKGMCDKIILIGQSLGGIVTLTAASYLPVDGVIAISTPCNPSTNKDLQQMKLLSTLRPMQVKDRHVRVNAQDNRLEADYPAYPFFALHGTVEVRELQNVLIQRLSLVKAPALVAQSHADAWVTPDSAGRIYNGLGSERKEIAWFEEMDHSMVRDAKREQVFEAIASFLATV
jgi:carboxylesterase